MRVIRLSGKGTMCLSCKGLNWWNETELIDKFTIQTESYPKRTSSISEAIAGINVSQQKANLT